MKITQVVPSFNSVNWKSPSGSLNKLNQFMIFETENPYGFPELTKYTGEIPKDLISYHDPRTKRGGKQIQDCFVHFNIDDYYFEDVWSTPNKLKSLDTRFSGVISTTYSVYSVHPQVMNLWNVYRNRWICKYCEYHGIPIIPQVLWADESSYDYAFSGLPKDSTILVSTVGTFRKSDRKLFIQGFKEMVERLEPETLLVYGEYFPLKFSDYCNKVVFYDSEWKKKRQVIKQRKEQGGK